MCAQSVRTKNWETDGIDRIEITAPFSSKVQIDSHSEKTIQLTYRSEGEYQAQMGLFDQQNGNVLVFSEYRNPIFVTSQDKLAAHKVIASQFQLTVPEQIPVSLHMKQGQLAVEGQFEALQLTLLSGSCRLSLQHTVGRLQTQSAPVEIRAQNMRIQAQSNGRVSDCESSTNGPLFQIISQSGTIRCITD